MSDLDEVTYFVLAIIERTTVAEQRRVAVARYAAQARRDPAVREIVSLLLAARRERGTASNVTEFRQR
jgi:hypothetical protein